MQIPMQTDAEQCNVIIGIIAPLLFLRPALSSPHTPPSNRRTVQSNGAEKTRVVQSVCVQLPLNETVRRGWLLLVFKWTDEAAGLNPPPPYFRLLDSKQTLIVLVKMTQKSETKTGGGDSFFTQCPCM